MLPRPHAWRRGRLAMNFVPLKQVINDVASYENRRSPITLTLLRLAEREVNIAIDIRQNPAWLEAFAADFTGGRSCGRGLCCFVDPKILAIAHRWAENRFAPWVYVVNEFTSCSRAAPTIDEKAIEMPFVPTVL